MAFEKMKKAVKATLEWLVHEQHPESWNRTVTRTSEQMPAFGKGSYGKRILELADGRPVHEIVEAIYTDELSNYGWETDIGVWKHLWDKEVIKTIAGLEEKGYIKLSPVTQQG